MFSDDGLQKLSERFVCVKIDPRDSMDALDHKRTQYVPEVVFLDSGKNFLGLLTDRSVEGMRRDMLQILATQ